MTDTDTPTDWTAIHAAMAEDKGDDWWLADWFEHQPEFSRDVHIAQVLREAMHDRDRYMAERDACREACQWRSIETAPKDGTFIDLWVPGEGRIADATWSTTSGWRAAGFVYGGDFGAVDMEPTHWRPLPAPPPADGE